MAKKCYAGNWYEVQRFIIDFLVSYLFAVIFIVPVLNVFFLRTLMGIKKKKKRK